MISVIFFSPLRNFLIILRIVNGREARSEEIYHPTNSLPHNRENMMKSDNDRPKVEKVASRYLNYGESRLQR